MSDLLNSVVESKAIWLVDCGVHSVDIRQEVEIVDNNINMPVASGDVVLGFIRSTPELQDIKVIVVSAYPEAPKIAEQLGADACLMKPIEIDEMNEIIERLLGEG